MASEGIGPQIRKQRRRLGLTLDELAGRTSISKPYLSLIETGRVANPPSDEKLRRIERTLGFGAGELVAQAHLQRTPSDVREALQKLVNDQRQRESAAAAPPAEGEAAAGAAPSRPALPVNLDQAYLSGVLQQIVGKSAGNVERVRTNAVPVINRVSAGYPKDFTDLDYPRGVADEYVGCPDVHDKDAFAARVHGDSMTPRFREGDIIIFSPAATWRDGDDCFVRFEDGQTTFKRVFVEKSEGGQPVLRLQPRNERYRPQIVPSQKIAALYKAVYRYQRLGDD